MSIGNRSGVAIPRQLCSPRLPQLDVIAEGVETVAQAEFLKQAGCPAIQGYLFSKPLPAEAITELMLGKAKR